jgi:hypothetical protein
MKKKETVCQLVDELMDIVYDPVVRKILKKIKKRAGQMEDRLLTYCNAIEDLGFKRVGRNYKKQ